MGNRKEKGPFDLLLEDMTNPNVKTFDDDKTFGGTQSKPNFKFDSLLKANNQRKGPRTKVTGFVDMFNDKDELIGSAVLRNISIGGFAVETHPCALANGAMVFVTISGKGMSLGKIKCKVQWITKMEESPENNRLIGFSVTETDEAQAKFELFVKSLTLSKK